MHDRSVFIICLATDFFGTPLITLYYNINKFVSISVIFDVVRKIHLIEQSSFYLFTQLIIHLSIFIFNMFI